MVSSHISEVTVLEQLILKIATYPEHTWIYAAGELERVDLNLECHLCTLNSRDFTDDENDQREIDLGAEGLKVLLSKQQFEDVLANLAARKDVDAVSADAAIDYYVIHDAFLPEHANQGEQTSAPNP